MKYKNIFPVLFSFLLFINCSSSKQQSTGIEILPASLLQPIGRFDIINQQLELISSAVHFGFSFKGKQCNIFASIQDANGHNYIQYELDGVYQKRIKIEGNNKQPIVINANTGGHHTIWIYKATEAHTGPVFIEKITGKNLHSIKLPDAPLIEFIGNSITCGAAADTTEVPCGKGVYHDQHNAYYAYPSRVSRTIGVNYIVSSVSGIGIYRNWNSLGPTMPRVYEKTDFQESSHRLWNFNTYNPNIVSIALGTNDFSNGDGKKERLPFDSSIFVSTYIKFVQLIKSKYPAAQIALLSSPMINGERRTRLQSYLTAVKENIDKLYSAGKKIALFFFEPMKAGGCSGHPSVEDHAILAAQLVPFFKNLL